MAPPICALNQMEQEGGHDGYTPTRWIEPLVGTDAVVSRNLESA
jgi:hypothetical protein